MILYKLKIVNFTHEEIIIAMRKRTTSQIICENFKIPSETIFQDYKCTYRSTVLFFGRLYIGQQHFLFIANMFGLVKKCSIKIDAVTKIQQSQDSSTITVVQKLDNHQDIQYQFGSFKNKNAYHLMRALWKGEQIQSDVFKQNDQEQESSKMGQQTDNGGHKLLTIEEGQVQANFFNAQAVESQKQKMVQIILPCSVEQFYDFFLADGATVYPRKKHLESRGGRDIVATEWRKNDELNSLVRQITGTLKVNGVPFVKQAGMSQVWLLKKQQDSLKLNIVTQMADVPYASYFNCEEHITVIKEGEKKCRMTIQATVVFNKSTYMKGTILSRTFEDLKLQYELWIKSVNTMLDQIRKKKEQTSKSKDVEYQKSEIHSQRVIPAPPSPTTPSKKPNRLLGLLNIQKLTVQQKVDLILKILLLLVIINVVQFMKSCF